MKIQFDQYSFILDDRRQLIRSGAMHYFRLPHPDLWWDRLRKLKAGGYNTVDLYFNWDFHSKAPGQYDFTGVRDIKRLLDMVQELGLYLIARPGPYINAETTRGGLPGWLLTQPGVILRNRQDGAFRYSPEYMGFVREWLDQILPFVKGRPNLLMVQVENEYSTEGMEPEYMQELIGIIRGHGIEVPTMHNDFYAAGLYADLVDIYAIDNYSVTNYDWDWRSFPELFSVLDNLEDNTRPSYCQNRPLMMAELQAGWFVGWKGGPYETIHKKLGREHIAIVTRSFLAQGGTAFNHYKAMGGTNWDHIGATDAYTSYDFSAPISESGLLTERYFEAKRMNLFLAHFDWTQTEPVDPSTLQLQPMPSLYRVRRSVSQPGASWITLRNLTPQSQRNSIAPGIDVEMPPFTMAFIPVDLPLKTGWTLQHINVEPLAQTENAMILPGDGPLTMRLATAMKHVEVEKPEWVSIEQTSGGDCEVQLRTPLQPDQITWARLNGTLILFLGADCINWLWHLEDNRYLIGPDMVRSSEEAYVSSPRSCWLLTEVGQLKQIQVKETGSVQLPVLENWDFKVGSADWQGATAEKLQSAWQGYRPLAEQRADMDSNGLYEGAVWYQYLFDGSAECLTLMAQHIWAVYLNGHCLLSSHTFHVPPDANSPEDEVTVQLPHEHLKADGANCLTIFVESLGHHKGFYSDSQDPRGVIKLELDGRDIAGTGWIRPEPLAATSDAKQAGQGPIVHAQTSFELAIPQELSSPIGVLVDVDCERVDIRLNGVLVGQYWRACRGQTKFYLPDGMLSGNGLNRLEMTLINFLPPLEIPEKSPKLKDRITLFSYQQLTKFSFRTADTAMTAHS